MRHEEHGSGANRILRVIFAIITLSLISIQLIEIVSYFIAYQGHHEHREKTLYWVSKSINVTFTCALFARSIIIQRHNLRDYKIRDGTMQSHRTNMILIFMAGLYFSTLGSIVFYKKDLILYRIFNFAYVLEFFMVAAHFIGGLEWGRLSIKSNPKQNDKLTHYQRWSINWWCCVYLIFSFINFITVTVISPWVGYHDFLELNDDLDDVTGTVYKYFVH